MCVIIFVFFINTGEYVATIVGSRVELCKKPGKRIAEVFCLLVSLKSKSK